VLLTDGTEATWRIQRFSRWVECSSSSANAVESDSFQLAGHVWSFKIRPCGRSDAPDDVSLFLVYNGAASFGTAFLNMLMLNNTTVAYTLKLQQSNGTTISEETQLNTFVVGQDLGSRHFANRLSVLESIGEDDTVVVRLCNVRIVDTAATTDKDGGAFWAVPRFGELVRCTKEDHHMQSDSFEMDGEQWRFWIYPCGQSSAQDGISLFLQYTGSKSVTAVFTLQLEQSDGTVIDHVTYSHLFAPEDTWGSRPFADRQLTLDAIADDDKLVTRVCKFRKVERVTTKREGMTMWQIPRFSNLVTCSKTDLLVESDLFEMAGEQWRLMVKPSGATEASGDIAAYLRYLGAAASVTASYTLVLYWNDVTSEPLATRTFAAHKFGPDTSWGTNTIANRETVLAEIADDDCLIVAVTEMEIPDTQVGAEEALEVAEQWFAQQRWRDAASAYEKALDAGHDNVHYVHQRRAFCFNEIGKHDEALKEWDAAVRAAPECPFSRVKRGEQHLKLGRMKKAEKDALYALKLRSDYPEGLELLKNATNSALLLPAKRPNKDSAASSAGSAPAECDEAFAEARKLEDSGDWTGAIAAYIKAISLGYPSVYACHNRQGICYTKLGQHEEAFHQFDTAVSLTPDEATLYYNRGRQHLVLGRLKEAEADAIKALQFKPDHQLAKKLQEDAQKRLAVPTEARDAFANAKRLEEKGDWSAAIAAYSRALESGYPQPHTCHNKQGICLAKLGLHEEAFRQFDTAVQLAPSDVASLRNRARKHQAFGRLKEAEQDALRAVEIKPENVAGRKLLEDIRQQMAETAETAFQSAQTLRLRKQFYEAIDAYASAIEHGHPNLFTCYNNRSLCHTMLGQHELALQDNNQCIREDPTDPMGYDHRARTFMDLGKLEMAEADAQMTLELDPDFDGAEEFLESVTAQLKVPVKARNAFSAATALYKEEKWLDASAKFQVAIEENHNEIARCHLYRGSCFEKIGTKESMKTCVKEYTFAVDKDEEDYRGWFTRGVTQGRLGKTREASSDRHRGMELASASILSNPGLLDEILGPDVAKAIEELSDREQHRAVRPLAASMMAKTLFAMKIWEAAAAAYTLMFKPAGCIEPMGVKILPPPQIMHQGHHDRGVCYQNLGRHAEAYEDFNAAVKGQPTNASAWFRRAQEQAALGRFHEAEADLHQAMSLSPSEPGAKELLSVVARKLKSKKSDAEATQNALLAELEEEAERAAKKKEKKKRQKQKKKQQKNKGKADEAAAELERAAAQAAAEKAAALAKAEERRLAAEAAEEEAAKAAAEAADSSDELDSRHGQTKVDQEGQKPQSGNHAAQSSKGKTKAKQQGNKGNAKGAAGVGVESSKSNSKSASAGKSEVHRSESDSDSDTEGGAISGHVEQHGGHQKKGRPKTVQEAMTAGGFDRLKRSGGWQNDICGPQPLLTITDQVRKAGSGGLRLVTLADELKKKWGSTSVNVGALGCYARHYDSSFELFDSDQSVAKGVPSSMKSFGATSVVRLKGSTTGAAQAAGKSHEATTMGDDAEIVSEEQAVQLLVDHIVNRSRCANVCCDRCRYCM
jgi:tetratricopeptide (TPR) repeat protein